MIQPRLKHIWLGREGKGLTSAEETFALERIEQRFGPLADGKVNPPRLEDLKLELPRLNPPTSRQTTAGAGDRTNGGGRVLRQIMAHNTDQA